MVNLSRDLRFCVGMQLNRLNKSRFTPRMSTISKRLVASTPHNHIQITEYRLEVEIKRFEKETVAQEKRCNQNVERRIWYAHDEFIEYDAQPATSCAVIKWCTETNNLNFKIDNKFSNNETKMDNLNFNGTYKLLASTFPFRT